MVTEKLNVVTDGGRRKLGVVTNGTASKRSAWLHFCPYRIRIGVQLSKVTEKLNGVTDGVGES